MNNVVGFPNIFLLDGGLSTGYVAVQVYPLFKSYFPLFGGMVMYGNEFKAKGHKI